MSFEAFKRIFSRKDPRKITVAASPGLTSFLDTALYRSHAGCLTSTVCAASVTLAAFLELESVSKTFLESILDHDFSNVDESIQTFASAGKEKEKEHSKSANKIIKEVSARGKQQNTSPPSQAEKYALPSRDLAESFACQCLQTVDICVQKIACDPISENNMQSFQRETRKSATSSLASDEKKSAQSNWRNDIKGVNCGLFQLYCPDFVWADEAIEICLREIRSLSKHRLLSVVDNIAATNEFSIDVQTQFQNRSKERIHVFVMQYLLSRRSRIHDSSIVTPFNLPTESILALSKLYHLIRWDIPSKIIQFRAALRSEAVISKRLYMIKMEYRGPLYDFLGKVSDLIRLPPLPILHHYYNLHHTDASKMDSNTNTNDRNLDVKNINAHSEKDIANTMDIPKITPSTMEEEKTCLSQKFEKCLQEPALTRALQMYQHLQLLEDAITSHLIPFLDLAKFLNTKNLRIETVPGILQSQDVPNLRKLVSRLLQVAESFSNHRELMLKSIATTNGNDNKRDFPGRMAKNNESYDIRPFLFEIMDAQFDAASDNLSLLSRIKFFLSSLILTTSNDEAIIKNRLRTLLNQLQTLAKLSQTKQAFNLSLSQNLRKETQSFVIPSSIVQKCQEPLDTDLFVAQYLDWCALIRLQTSELKTPSFIEKINQEMKGMRWLEIQLNLSLSSQQSFLELKEEISNIESSVETSFSILRKSVLDISLREMNLLIELKQPEEWTQRIELGKKYDENIKENKLSPDLVLEESMNAYSDCELTLKFKDSQALGIFGDQLICAGCSLP